MLYSVRLGQGMNGRPGRFHYGWVVVAVCMAAIFGVSFFSTGISVFLSAMRQVYGFSGTETATVMTVCSASALVATLVSDRFYNVLGARRGLALSMASGALAYLMFYLAGGNIYTYHVGALFGGFAYALGFMMPASILMRRWFSSNRAFALALCSSGSGLSTAVGCPIAQYVIGSSGIGSAFVLLFVYFVVVAVAAAVLVRNRPGDIGREPFGGESEADRPAGRSDSASATGAVFVVLMVASLFLGMCSVPSTSNLSLNFTGAGIDGMTVAMGLSVFGIVLLFSKLVFGWVVDIKGMRFATVLFGSVLVFGMACAFASMLWPSVLLMVLSLALMGAGYPLMSLGYPNWAADLTSQEEYPRAMRRFLVMYQLGILVCSPLPGIIADSTGSYSWAYLMFAVLTALVIVMASAVYWRIGDVRKDNDGRSS